MNRLSHSTGFRRQGRGFLYALSLALLLLALTACGSSSEGSSDQGGGSSGLPKEIRIGYQVSPNGELMAKALGLAEKKFPGVKVSWLKFDAGRDVNAAMAGGSIDFGMVGTPPGASGIAQGLPDEIYYIHDIIGESEALVVKTSAGIGSLEDLKGKTIATTFSSTSHFSLLSALKQKNIDPSGIKIIDMPAPEMAAAWQRGDIDGAYIWQPVQSKLIADGGKVIVTSKEVAAGGGITGEFGVVSKEFASKYPEAVKGYIEVLDEGTKYYRDHAEEASGLLAKELGLSPQETLTAMKQITVLDASEQTLPEYMGTPDKPGAFGALLKETADFLVEQKSIKSAPGLKTFQEAIRSDLYLK